MGVGRVKIASMGLITPLGASRWATFAALCDGRCITDRLADHDVDTPPTPFEIVRACGHIPNSNFAPGDPSVNLALRVIDQALQEAGLGFDALSHIPIIVASSKGAILSIIEPPISTPGQTHGFPSPHGILCDQLKASTGVIQCRCIVAACASGLAALDLGARIVRRGQTPRVLVVATESSLTPLLVASYQRLGVLPSPTINEYRCLALDKRRSGFALSDAAAAVLLQAVSENDDEPNIELLGSRSLAQAFDIVRSPENRCALSRVAYWTATLGSPLDCIHPHATGTSENDAAELATYQRSIPTQSKDIIAYACKGALGHSLGSSGLVSLVIAATIGQTGRIPPMPWLESPIQTRFQLNRSGVDKQLCNHAVFAAGFGGHIAAAVIRCSRNRERDRASPVDARK